MPPGPTMSKRFETVLKQRASQHIQDQVGSLASFNSFTASATMRREIDPAATEDRGASKLMMDLIAALVPHTAISCRADPRRLCPRDQNVSPSHLPVGRFAPKAVRYRVDCTASIALSGGSSQSLDGNGYHLGHGCHPTKPRSPAVPNTVCPPAESPTPPTGKSARALEADWSPPVFQHIFPHRSDLIAADNFHRLPPSRKRPGALRFSVHPVTVF